MEFYRIYSIYFMCKIVKLKLDTATIKNEYSIFYQKLAFINSEP